MSSAVRALVIPFAALALATTACSPSGGRATREQQAVASRLTGAWDVTFVLDRAPLGPAAGDTGAAHPEARGTLALIAAERDERNAALPSPVTHTGVYAVDLRTLGFALPAPGPVPSLVATIVLPDTLVAVLPAGVDESVLVLRGAMRGDSVAGTWSYGGRAAGGWGGAVVLRRHRSESR